MPKLSQSRWCRETSPRVLKGIPFKGHPCSIWGTSKTSLTAKMPKIMRTNNLFYSNINYPQTCYWQQHTAPCPKEFIIWALQDLTKWCLAGPSSREMTQGIRMGQCLSKLLWEGIADHSSCSIWDSHCSWMQQTSGGFGGQKQWNYL